MGNGSEVVGAESCNSMLATFRQTMSTTYRNLRMEAFRQKE